MEKEKMFETLRDDFVEIVEKTDGANFFHRIGVDKDKALFQSVFTSAMSTFLLKGKAEALAKAAEGCETLSELVLMSFILGMAHENLDTVMDEMVGEFKKRGSHE